MNFLSKLWLSAATLFEPVQYLFNGNFWNVFAKKFGTFKNVKLIDLACGTGEINRYIKPKKYLGVDFNKFYISFALKKFGKSNIEFIISDIANFKATNRYDTALLISAAHHLNDKQIVKVCRNLKQNKVKNFLIIDALPQGWLSKALEWLDANLGGGEYFRSLSDMEKLVSKEYRIKRKGLFRADKSFYLYYYLEVIL